MERKLLPKSRFFTAFRRLNDDGQALYLPISLNKQSFWKDL
jgi:hypothetical protein